MLATPEPPELSDAVSVKVAALVTKGCVDALGYFGVPMARLL